MLSQVREICSHCQFRIDGVQCVSSLYGADDLLLCESCSKYEEEMIDKKGTNDIPELLKMYVKSC